MVDTNKITIEKLNNSNYQIWKYKMELVLIKDQVWNVVGEDLPRNPSAEWKKKDDRARALIGLLVEDSEFIHVKKSKTSKESWTILKNRHEKPTLTNKISLLKRICGLQMHEDDEMEEHINKMTNLVEQLASLGEELADNMVVAMILRSLPDSYDALIAALETRPEEDLTVAYIVGKLTDEFKRRMEQKLFTQKYSESESSILKISSGRRQFQRDCNFCGKPGHLRANCFAFKKYVENGKNKPEESLEPIASVNVVTEEDYDYLF